jgi:hypothetical protein
MFVAAVCQRLHLPREDPSMDASSRLRAAAKHGRRRTGLRGGDPASPRRWFACGSKIIARRDACMRLRMALKLAAMQCDQ